MKKIIYKLTFAFVFSLFILCTTQESTVSAAIANKPGDIIITNSTSSKGILGHMGIYIDSKTILHTSGWKSEPYPLPISESKWHKRYKHSKVIRPNSSALGKKAAQQAVKHFKGKTIPYKLTSGVTNIKNTYCSELVWYSYYKAGKEFKTYNPTARLFARPSIIKPYDYTNVANVKHNGFKWIDSKW